VRVSRGERPVSVAVTVAVAVPFKVTVFSFYVGRRVLPFDFHALFLLPISLLERSDL